ncbi:MAG TPA: polysaccharide lyase family 1 protein [Vicinamibacteria bacterium]
MRTLNARSICLVLSLAALAAPPAEAGRRDLGRETLPAGDGWASEGAGTTGGSAAAPEQVYVVTNRRELVAALNDGVYPPPSSTPSNAPKIIYVDGTIDANVDDDHRPLTCVDYYRNDFTIEKFLEAYDPATWGRVRPTGPMEQARLASQAAQQARVRIRVGSNTTIVGLGRKATVRGAWLDIRRHSTAGGNPTNIIIRNLNFLDTYDCFPQWSPTDGALGSWNAEYDSVSLRQANHVWIDHNRFEDVETADDTLPTYFGVTFQVHDGLLDITNESDLVTVSWNEFKNHDKVMLIGSSDNPNPPDRGKLRVTLHHNLWEDLGQRTPRVRFGQVHVYNNLYRLPDVDDYGYSLGVGIESAIYAENNLFEAPREITPDQVIERFNGTAIHATGTLWLTGWRLRQVDLVAAYNAVNDPDLGTDVGWVPTLFRRVDHTLHAAALVRAFAGPFSWGHHHGPGR